ncbi:type IV toxin-antitoxin system AbiEi family antitoxin domain-containing protein [Phytoactinopolyspora limicola]|uniref:type IV toxin-antitoxin system AbiEi family antitoxin domain-containing protein n=1 Tax=Phytoactinopolyspora limicola TaxID=2715536 RepID=UPI00140964E1|nr:type IV toxin-antitoxin system AbiEi family antitoxin domain-containing protein [Phytoactinopolyspora limicola]
MTVADQIAAIARTQDALVTRGQALAAGMSKAALRHTLERGRWQRVARGVYATFSGPLQARHRLRAALLYAGPDAVVSGADACRAYGLRYVPAAAIATVLVPNSVQRAATSFAHVRRVRRLPGRRNVLGGLPVAPPERAVVDTCIRLTSLQDIRALICEAVQKGLTSPDALRSALGGARWRGAREIRIALDDVTAGCRSAPECELRDLVRQSSVLDEPRWNVPLPGVTDGTLIPDACWPDARVVVEIDSAEWHRYGDRVEHTEQRRARYAALGWTVVPISPRRLRSEPAAVLAQIEAAVQVGITRRARYA